MGEGIGFSVNDARSNRDILEKEERILTSTSYCTQKLIQDLKTKCEKWQNKLSTGKHKRIFLWLGGKISYKDKKIIGKLNSMLYTQDMWVLMSIKWHVQEDQYYSWQAKK